MTSRRSSTSSPGFIVRNVVAGPLEPLPKADLPSQLCAFTAAVLRAEAASEPGWYDLIHSHYWLSGQVGWLAKERWGVPLVHSMHTLARVKNAALAEGDAPEPSLRAIGEAQVVEAADRLIANTAAEARQLIDLYDADPAVVSVVPPGVDLSLYRPGSRAAARARLGLPADRDVLLFVGRIQPLKAPDLLIRALAVMIDRTPSLRDRLMAVIVGGVSGSGVAEPDHLARLADQLGVADLVRFEPPAAGDRLADFYRAASCHRRSVVQRIVWSRRTRIASVRDAGRRRACRRPRHHRQRRRYPDCSSMDTSRRRTPTY